MRRILSIDGGGIKGAFPAAFLAEVEARRSAATSTSSRAPRRAASSRWASDSGRRQRTCFASTSSRARGSSRVAGGGSACGGSPRPSTTPPPCATRSRMRSGTTPFRPARSLNAETGDIYLYKTPHDARIRFDGDRAAVDVALATAAAPTYLPTHWPTIGPPMIDGDLWANNPIAVAVTEALGVLRWSADEIEVLSLVHDQSAGGRLPASGRVLRRRGSGLRWYLV